MPHHDEKGRISPAQSKTAQRLRGKSLGDIAESHGYPISHTRHRYGEKVAGLAGMHRMEQLKKANPNKAKKARLIIKTRQGKAKNPQQEHHWVKGYSEVKKGNNPKPNANYFMGDNPKTWKGR